MLTSELEQRLVKEGLKPVYLVQGPEGFLRGEALRMIREAAGKDNTPTDVTELDAAEMDARKLFDDLRTPSLFAPRRLIVIDNAANLFSESLPLLAGYVKGPAPRTVLVLVAEELGKPKTGRKKGRAKKTEEPTTANPAAVLQKVASVECPVITPRDLPAWCAARARIYGKQMDYNAGRTLGELVGPNLGQLDGQIRSLAAYVKDRPRITGDDVTDLVGGDRVRTIWELVGATTERTPDKGIRALDRLMLDSENTPGRLIAAIAKEVRRLLTLKELLDARTPRAEIERRTRMQGWLIEKLSKSVYSVSADQLRGRLRLLLEADMACKTSGGNDRWIMERLVLKLCA